MKYKYKLVENTGGEDTPIGGGSKGIPKSSINIVLTPSSDTTVKDIEDALNRWIVIVITSRCRIATSRLQFLFHCHHESTMTLEKHSLQCLFQSFFFQKGILR